MDRGRWTTTAVVIVGLFVALASLWLTFYLFFNVVLWGLAYHGSPPSGVDAAGDLFWGTGVACLVAGISALVGLWRRTPIPFLVAGTALAVVTALLVRAQPDLQAIRAGVPVWLIPVGTASAALSLAAAWLRHRPNTYLAIATLLTAVAAGAAIVLIATASERVCPHLSANHERWFEASLTKPTRSLRAARLQQSTTNPSDWFVIAVLAGEGFEGFVGKADVGIWLMDVPGASSAREVAVQADPDRIYAVNLLAASVSNLPPKPIPAQALAQLDACREEVLREASG